MKLERIIVWLVCCAISAATNAIGEETGGGDPLPNPDVLESGIVIDCGQWPPEYAEELGSSFRAACEKNSKLIGYSRAWVLQLKNVPRAALENPKSFRCKAVAEQNTGYACVGVKDD